MSKNRDERSCLSALSLSKGVRKKKLWIKAGDASVGEDIYKVLRLTKLIMWVCVLTKEILE